MKAAGSVTEDILCFPADPNIHYRVNNSPSMTIILNQTNLYEALTTYLLKKENNIRALPTSSSSKECPNFWVSNLTSVRFSLRY